MADRVGGRIIGVGKGVLGVSGMEISQLFGSNVRG